MIFSDNLQGQYLLLLLRIRSAHLNILGFAMVLTNTGIFLHGLKLCGESRT